MANGVHDGEVETAVDMGTAVRAGAVTSVELVERALQSGVVGHLVGRSPGRDEMAGVPEVVPVAEEQIRRPQERGLDDEHDQKGDVWSERLRHRRYNGGVLAAKGVAESNLFLMSGIEPPT